MNPSHLYQTVRTANVVLFTAALAAMLNQNVTSALARIDQGHWHSADRSLTVVDRTGSPSWHEATRHAVTAFNRVSSGTGLQVEWTSGSGPCKADRKRIEICQSTSQSLADDLHLDRQGLVEVRAGSDRTRAHIRGASILVCSNCRLEASRRRVVATHELGHALGLAHNRRLGSLMFPSGGPDRPDEQDVKALRQLYAHVDVDERCGIFDLRLGRLCL